MTKWSGYRWSHKSRFQLAHLQQPATHSVLKLLASTVTTLVSLSAVLLSNTNTVGCNFTTMW